MTKLDRAYQSDIDKFLRDFDQKHLKSASQHKEIAKHARIALLRDNPDAKRDNEKIWQD